MGREASALAFPRGSMGTMPAMPGNDACPPRVQGAPNPPPPSSPCFRRPRWGAVRAMKLALERPSVVRPFMRNGQRPKIPPPLVVLLMYRGTEESMSVVRSCAKWRSDTRCLVEPVFSMITMKRSASGDPGWEVAGGLSRPLPPAGHPRGRSPGSSRRTPSQGAFGYSQDQPRVTPATARRHP